MRVNAQQRSWRDKSSTIVDHLERETNWLLYQCKQTGKLPERKRSSKWKTQNISAIDLPSPVRSRRQKRQTEEKRRAKPPSKENLLATRIQSRARGYIVRKQRDQRIREVKDWFDDPPIVKPWQEQQIAQKGGRPVLLVSLPPESEGSNGRTRTPKTGGKMSKSVSFKDVAPVWAANPRPADQLSVDLVDMGVEHVDDFSDSDEEQQEDQDNFELSDTDSEGDDDVAWTLRRVKSMPQKKLGPWEARRHNSTGQLFFTHQNELGKIKCTWEAPAGFSDWEEYEDKITGRPYYHCKETGAVQWEPPKMVGMGNGSKTLTARSLGAIFTQSFHSLPTEQKEAALNIELSDSEEEAEDKSGAESGAESEPEEAPVLA